MDYFLTEEDFENEVTDVQLAIKWRELSVGTIYKIVNSRVLNTMYGPATILEMHTRDGEIEEVWAPPSLAKRLQGANLPTFVRPLGLQPHYKDPNMLYHAYDLV